MHCEIRPAEIPDLSELQAIERAAATLFSDADLPPGMREETQSMDTLRESRREGLLWVAEVSGAPVGFLQAAILDGNLHIREMDVHPAHGRKGIGARLVDAAIRAAGARGCPRVTLTTFSHLPWNAPYYTRLGFRMMTDAECGPALQASRARENSRLKNRVAMCRDLAVATGDHNAT